MEMYIDGCWVDSPVRRPLISSYRGEEIDQVPEATDEQIERCLAAAEKGAAAMARLTAAERSEILNRAASLLAENKEDMARTITTEEGKPLREARAEVERMPALLRLCAFEGAQLRGETLPLDAQAGVKGRLGMTLRVPCGVVVAITPFNYPVLLVLHKIGPALAAGNAVILKPSSYTPLTAAKLTKIFLEAGLPEHGLQCITGSGSRIGPALCSDERIRKISFTGSYKVGETICHSAGLKKLSMELGSNSPLVALSDADLEQVAELTRIGGYVNAGQVCISVQRVLVDHSKYGDCLDLLKSKVESIQIGDPFEENTELSAMVSEHEARRVESWIKEDVGNGARLVTGGERSGAVFAPTIVADVVPQMRVFREELFGPAIAVTSVNGLDEAIALANDSRYGLSASVFTKNIDDAFRFVQETQSGNVHVNWSPTWRADLMPYGGFKNSGIGKEGPRYAIQEMTELKTVVFHGLHS